MEVHAAVGISAAYRKADTGPQLHAVLAGDMTDSEPSRPEPARTDGMLARGVPRGATAADIPELVDLRAVMLSGLGQDPGAEAAPWREQAVTWLNERLARPDEWAIRVVGPPGGPLAACGAAWLTEHLPGPATPDGRRGYIGFMCTRPDARRRGHASTILASLIDWLTTRGVGRFELHASPDGRALYRRAGFGEDAYVAMYRCLAPRER